jgi:Arabinofuranosyltransferase N terminal/Arabinofuranosyltransferase A C terminal
MSARIVEHTDDPVDLPSDDEPAYRWARIVPRIANLWAILTWIIALPVGIIAITLIDLNPITARGATLPIAIGIVGGGVLLMLALWRPSDILTGVAAGGYAAWVGITLAISYTGTPFGDSGLRGDAARLAAMATRYSDTWLPVDGFVPSVPTEYPPLYPWLLGRISNVLDLPAWSLMSHSEVLLMSAAVLLGFLCWNGLVPPPVALALAVIPPWVFGQPRKSYEIVVLAVFVPWVIRTLTNRPRREGGFHWLVGGVIGGLMIQVYQGYFLFSAIGLAAVIILTWRRADERGRYVRHVMGVVVTAFVVAAWYLLPFLYGTFAIGGERVNDYYISTPIIDQPLGLGFLSAPFSSLEATLEILGLVGILWFARSQWWAPPFLAIAAGAYVFRWLMVLVFTVNGHTMYLHYTSRLISTVLISGGVLTIVTVAAIMTRERWPPAQRSRIGLLAICALVVAAAFGGLRLWMPFPPGMASVDRGDVEASANLVTFAHAEPLPDGNLPRYRPPEITVRWFPVEPIERTVERELGDDARPVTLAIDERLFAYLPWEAYVPVHRPAANTFVHYDDRVEELRRLAAIRDPDEFASATQDTPYGGIDVFVLRERGPGWAWGDVFFQREQFDDKYWAVDDSLPEDVVVAVRRTRGNSP